MSFDYGKPCTRCLLEEAGNRDLAQIIAERIAVMPAAEKADERLYRQRLEICLKCDALNGGTCGKCGCYVELRAARIKGYCPAAEKFW